MGLIRESGFPKRTIEKLAGAIAREHASGTICAVRTRRESND